MGGGGLGAKEGWGAAFTSTVFKGASIVITTD